MCWSVWQLFPGYQQGNIISPSSVTTHDTMFLPLIFLPALVSSEGILDSLMSRFRPLMTQLDGVASHIMSPSQQQNKGIPGDCENLRAACLVFSLHF